MRTQSRKGYSPVPASLSSDSPNLARVQIDTLSVMQSALDQETQPLLVFRHEAFEHLGYFADILKARSMSFVYKDLDHPVPTSSFAGLIVMGGPQSANDPLPGLAAELEVIEHAISQEKPVLGICLGSQLIAKALGARVYKNSHKEIGWAPVH